tara:strand:- start:668 stop:907 length:240 start_codon:yes stop_codon:yes gene_type:complete
MAKKDKVKPKDPGSDANYKDPRVFQEYMDYTFSKKGNKEFLDREYATNERLRREAKAKEEEKALIESRRRGTSQPRGYI